MGSEERFGSESVRRARGFEYRAGEEEVLHIECNTWSIVYLPGQILYCCFIRDGTT